MGSVQKISGIHHVSAIGTNIQKSIDFYTSVLGLRLIKRTVKFDEPEVYQLVFGNKVGSPENNLSIFPHHDLKQGRHGTGMVNTTTYSVPMKALDFWKERFDKLGISYKHPQQRFGEEVYIYFEDRDGLGIELVFNDKDQREGYAHEDIPKEKAIRGFYNVEIWERNYARLAGLFIQQFSLHLIEEKGTRKRFAAADMPGKYVDVVSVPDAPRGFKGYGTVHRLAFTTSNVDTLFQLREQLNNLGLSPSFIIDKKYFQSVYFETFSGIGMEVSTATPGYTIDET